MSKWVTSPLLLVLFSMVVACGGESSSEAPECPAFTRIVGGTFERNTDTLTWTLEVEDIPNTFVVNHSTLPESYLEYAFGIDVDGDDDGTAELSVSAQSFKFSGTKERQTSDILSVTQEDLWLRNGNSFDRLGDIDVSLEKSTFVFVVDASLTAELDSVTEARQSSWSTIYNDGSRIRPCTDVWP